MGERVAASGAPSDYYGEEVDALARCRRWRAQCPPRPVPLAVQWVRWRAQHPPRIYAQARLQRTQARRLDEADPSLAFGGAFGAPTNVAAQAQFFKKHIEPWAPLLMQDIEAAKSAVFYAPVGTIGRAFMDIESAAFDMGEAG